MIRYGVWKKSLDTGQRMLFYKLPKLIWENTEIGYDDGSLEQTKWW